MPANLLDDRWDVPIRRKTKKNPEIVFRRPATADGKAITSKTQ